MEDYRKTIKMPEGSWANLRDHSRCVHLLFHDWPVIVIPVYVYNTTHMGTTYSLYISNLDWEMYTKLLYIMERSSNNSARVKIPSTKFKR